MTYERNTTNKLAIDIPLLGMINNRVSVIKAIRTISGMGLKEAKDLSESPGRHVLTVSTILTKNELDTETRTLQTNGVKIASYVEDLLENLRKLAVEAIEQHEDEIANEILQFVLAEKLRRAG